MVSRVFEVVAGIISCVYILTVVVCASTCHNFIDHNLHLIAKNVTLIPIRLCCIFVHYEFVDVYDCNLSIFLYDYAEGSRIIG